MAKEPKEKETKISDKKTFKEKDPNKYVDLEPTLDRNYYAVSESKSKTIVLTFGRFSPPTIGHEKLVNKIISEAAARKADAAIYTSHTQDSKKNPLSYEDKVSFMTKAFGKIVKKSKARTIIEVMKELNGKYENVVVIVGSDRVPEFSRLLETYNGKEYNFDDIKVISAGERDPDAEDVTGMSASKMRALASQKDLEGFKSGLPKKLKPSAEEVYKAVLKGMKIMEDFEYSEETLEEKVVPLSYAARKKRALTMKRYAGKISRMRERALKRRSTPEKLLKKARRRALDFIKKRLAGKRAYSDLTPSEKIMVDKRAARIPDAAIERIARKQVPQVRKIEAERLSSLAHPKEDKSTRGINIKVNEEFTNFLENFYSDLASEGDSKQALHKKAFHSMYKKEGAVKTDGRFRFFRRKMAESSYDIVAEAAELMEQVESLYEGVNADRTKEQIASEKKSDAMRHKRMMDRARAMDKNMRESSEYIKKILEREKNHKKIATALKKFNERVTDIPPVEHLDHAADILDSLKLNFSPKELVDLHNRVKNSKSLKASYANVDAWESVDPSNITEAEVDPSKREWGTSSLTKTYRDDTPGQEDMDINEKFKSFLEEKDKPKGLWHNIHARRKKGLRPKRPGEKGYPKTLDIE
jgi:nicotinic acid mononucleotide adenylyltransferase